MELVLNLSMHRTLLLLARLLQYELLMTPNVSPLLQDLVFRLVVENIILLPNPYLLVHLMIPNLGNRRYQLMTLDYPN